MKKLTLSIAAAAVILGGVHTSYGDCGQQHAERCLISDTDISKDSTDIETADKVRVIISVLSRFKLPF